MKSTPSVIIRIFLWGVLLIGGLYISIKQDIIQHAVLFHNIIFHCLSFAIGLILIYFAFKASARGGRELAKEGRSGDLARLETDTLVTSGIYAKMRHPMLFGLMLIPPGLAFLVGSPTFILLIAPLELLFIALMTLIFEEMECRIKFGKAYKTYAQKVPMVCIKKSCLKELFA